MSKTQEEQGVISDTEENNVSVEEDKSETVETNAEDVTENVSEQETSSEESSTQEDVVDAPVEELSEVDQLNEKIKELEASVTAEKDKYLRACAEIENVKKRKNQEIENTRKFSNEKLIQEFLPILDSFDRAKDHLDQLQDIDEEVLNGFTMITKQFNSTFEKLSVEAIDALNKKFDPNEHQAMMSEENKEVDPDTVIRVLQTGYKLNGRVIRPSMVVVSK